MTVQILNGTERAHVLKCGPSWEVIDPLKDMAGHWTTWRCRLNSQFPSPSWQMAEETWCRDVVSRGKY